MLAATLVLIRRRVTTVTKMEPRTRHSAIESVTHVHCVGRASNVTVGSHLRYRQRGRFEIPPCAGQSVRPSPKRLGSAQCLASLSTRPNREFGQEAQGVHEVRPKITSALTGK